LQSWLDAGNDVGLMSESGCPGIADPGAEVIQWAHRSGYEVVPLVGPSSILLALMASGFNGQSFVFHGYLPNKKEELVKKVKLLEQNAGRLNQSQIFIETPYRNLTMYDILVSTLQPNTHLSIHMGLTGPHAYSKSKTVKEWRKLGCSELRKDIPAIYIIG
ncbi:MAG TPA: SAM-dependent methyltransferase, partial [Saprospiraceae bacterium]|nr:SAM-dependent methyltransferase [Saprospiraceae bacterium]